MDAATWGLIGGIGGSLVGLLGGVFGTWASLRACRTPAERAVAVRWSVVFWVGVGLFLGLFLGLPEPYRWLLWLVYPVALVFAVLRCNRQMAEARTKNG